MSKPEPKEMSKSFQNVLDREMERSAADGREPPLSKVEMQAETKPPEPWDIRGGRPGSKSPAMSDQEIRARALECAVRLYVGLNHGDPMTVVEQAEEFEAYIKTGESK